jgi:hypothetical protein
MEAYLSDSSVLSVEPGNEVWYTTVNVNKHCGPAVVIGCMFMYWYDYINQCSAVRRTGLC